MESNGKSVDKHNKKLQVPASPLIWGDLEQTHSTAFSISSPRTGKTKFRYSYPRNAIECYLPEGWKESHKTLIFNALAQAEALAIGQENFEEPHKTFKGKRINQLMG